MLDFAKKNYQRQCNAMQYSTWRAISYILRTIIFNFVHNFLNSFFGVNLVVVLRISNSSNQWGKAQMCINNNNLAPQELYTMCWGPRVIVVAF